MARNESSEPGFTDTDEVAPSDTMLAEGSHAPTISGFSDSLATVSNPPSSLPDTVRSLSEVPREHYAVGAPFAKGGIGQISAALDVRLGRRVAIKELRRSNRFAQQRFAREIKITAKLQHPNIVQVHEAGRWPDGEPFFAMQLVDGDSLEGAIESCVTLQDHLRLLRHVSDVANAMAHAHTRRIVHRDLKPGNVLVGPFGETVVIDWGLAKDLGEEEDDEELSAIAGETVPDRYQTTEGVVLGTPSYMPPEQAAGRTVDERADVYALGAIMYQALSGKAPYFEYHPKRVLERVVAAPPTPLSEVQPGLPKDLLAIVDKAMAREPSERYRTAARMAEELHRFTSGRLVAAYDYSLADLLRRFVRRHRAVITTAVLGLVVLLGFGAWSFRRIARERDAAHAAELAEKRARELETQARADAERRLDEAALSAARSDLAHDPTSAVARLKRLGVVIPGAATVAADAIERGVAKRVLRGHTDRIDAVVYSRDGTYLASSGVDGVIRLEHRASKKTRLLERHKTRVPAIAFAGDQLVSADYEGRILVWDVASGAVLQELDGPTNKEVRAIAVSADGTRIAAVSEDGVRIYDPKKGKPEWVLEQVVDRAAFAAFLPDASRLLTGSHRGELRVWSLSGGAHQVLSGHEGVVHDAAVSPDGEWIVSAGEDGTVRRWSLEDGEGTIIGRHERGARVVRFLDASRVVTGGMDGEVVLRRVADGSSRVVALHEERVTAIATHDEHWIASAGWDKRTVLIDDASKAVHTLQGHDSVISTLAFAPDGSELASGSWDRSVRLWPTESPSLQVQAHDVGVKTVAFDPSGARVASGGHDDRVRLWDAKTGEAQRVLTGHTDHVFRVVFSPTGKQVASSSDDRTVRLWNVEDGSHEVFEGHAADVEELAFSSDGKWLVSAGEDSKVGLWPTSGGEGQLLRGHERAVTAVAFMPGDATLVTASLDGTLALWSVPEGKRQRGEKLHEGGAMFLSVSDAGQIASVGRDGRVLLWDTKGEPRLIARRSGVERVAIAADGTQVAFAVANGQVGLCALSGPTPICRALVGHEERVHAMHFTSDGSMLVTGSEDGTVRIWSTTTGECRPLRMHHAPVFDVALHGDRIATASGDRTMGLLQITPPPAPSALRALLNDLTEMVLPTDVGVGTSPLPTAAPSGSN